MIPASIRRGPFRWSISPFRLRRKTPLRRCRSRLATAAEVLEDRTLLSTFFIERVNVGSDGSQANGPTGSGGFISADGRFAGFTSQATNLVPGDTNGVTDGFLRDRLTGQTFRVTSAPDGPQANGSGAVSAVSPDGRFVLIGSNASNLVPGDSNGQEDVFVIDRLSGEIDRVSVSSAGQQANARSSTGAMSADGRYVAFWSNASSLVAGDTNQQADVFWHDRVTGETRRVSVASDGTQAAGVPHVPGHVLSRVLPGGITDDGRFVVFDSDATNLVPGDTNGVRDIFVHDVVTGQTTRVSVASDGSQAVAPNPPGLTGSDAARITPDGRFVVFNSNATNLVPGDTNGAFDIFRHDRLTGQTIRVNVASDGAQDSIGAGTPSISADGRFVAFSSGGPDLVPGDTNGFADVFVHDVLTGQTVRLSVAADGTQGNASSGESAISADGQFVLFGSEASNLVPGDTNGFLDYFVVPNPLFFGEIHGQKFEDTDGDGVRDVGEPGLDGWTIELVDQSTGSVVATQITHSVDLNADGAIDPVTEQGLYWFTNLAPGNYQVREVLQPGWQQTFPRNLSFAPPANFDAGNDPFSVTAGDLDGDGDLDLATANQGANDVSVLLNNGDGSFAAALHFAVGASPRALTAADLDGDGNLDLAVANAISNSVSVLRNNGDGTFAPAAKLCRRS